MATACLDVASHRIGHFLPALMKWIGKLLICHNNKVQMLIDRHVEKQICERAKKLFLYIYFGIQFICLLTICFYSCFILFYLVNKMMSCFSYINSLFATIAFIRVGDSLHLVTGIQNVLLSLQRSKFYCCQ